MPQRSVAGILERLGLTAASGVDRLGQILEVAAAQLPQTGRRVAAQLVAQCVEGLVRGRTAHTPKY